MNAVGKQGDENGKSPPRSCLKLALKAILVALAVLVVMGTGAALAGYMVYDRVTRPGVPGENVRVVIPEGVSGRAVGRILAEHKLIEHAWFFRVAAHLEKPGLFRHGAYDLPRGLSALELLRLLHAGPNAALRPEDIPEELKLRVPEGLTIAQVAAMFEDSEVFVAAASDPELISRLGIRANTLEGFLMPDTYFFDKKPTPQEAVARMVSQFQKTYAALVSEIPDADTADLFKTVTVASLVEEEARVDEERPLIAAVIYNRLARGMPLALDCTLQYALNKYGERMLDKDKEVDSPYNTYRYTGLPPGPISSPGAAALRAALQPAKVDYLYFVSNADGRTHTFSRTMPEHTQAVRRYRKEIAVQRKALGSDPTESRP